VSRQQIRHDFSLGASGAAILSEYNGAITAGIKIAGIACEAATTTPGRRLRDFFSHRESGAWRV